MTNHSLSSTYSNDAADSTFTAAKISGGAPGTQGVYDTGFRLFRGTLWAMLFEGSGSALILLVWFVLKKS